MSNKEHNEYIKELRATTKALLKSKSKSQEFYHSAGIHTKNGNLTSIYKTPKIGFKTPNDNR